MRYFKLIYDYEKDDPLTSITEKIIKRTNFFTEDFPYKLKKLDKLSSGVMLCLSIILRKEIF